MFIIFIVINFQLTNRGNGEENMYRCEEEKEQRYFTSEKNG